MVRVEPPETMCPARRSDSAARARASGSMPGWCQKRRSSVATRVSTSAGETSSTAVRSRQTPPGAGRNATVRPCRSTISDPVAVRRERSGGNSRSRTQAVAAKAAMQAATPAAQRTRRFRRLAMGAGVGGAASARSVSPSSSWPALCRPPTTLSDWLPLPGGHAAHVVGGRARPDHDGGGAGATAAPAAAAPAAGTPATAAPTAAAPTAGVPPAAPATAAPASASPRGTGPPAASSPSAGGPCRVPLSRASPLIQAAAP